VLLLIQVHFVAELLSSTEERDPLSVVLTLRDDFYGRVLGDLALADRLQDKIVHAPRAQRQGPRGGRLTQLQCVGF
jgi:hypothetical protein